MGIVPIREEARASDFLFEKSGKVESPTTSIKEGGKRWEKWERAVAGRIATEDEIFEFEERSAIREFGAGFSRAQAEAVAIRDVFGERPLPLMPDYMQRAAKDLQSIIVKAEG